MTTEFDRLYRIKEYIHLGGHVHRFQVEFAIGLFSFPIPFSWCKIGSLKTLKDAKESIDRYIDYDVREKEAKKSKKYRIIKYP